MAAEFVDHLNPRWQGDPWKANHIANKIAFQAGYFPVIFQGRGRLRLDNTPQQWTMAWYITQTNNAVLARLYGRIYSETAQELACLRLHNGQMQWVVWKHEGRDVLFDIPQHLIMPGDPVQTNYWMVSSTSINPKSYQQLFGWKQAAKPENPAHKTSVKLAVQPHAAQWLLDYLEFDLPAHVYLGWFQIGRPEENMPTMVLMHAP